METKKEKEEITIFTLEKHLKEFTRDLDVMLMSEIIEETKKLNKIVEELKKKYN